MIHPKLLVYVAVGFLAGELIAGGADPLVFLGAVVLCMVLARLLGAEGSDAS